MTIDNKDKDALEDEMRTIDEKLRKSRKLNWRDRGPILMRRKEIYEALHPETKK